MILLIIIFLICPAVLLSVIFRLFLRQSPYPKSPTNLPPGSMGLPFLGETLQLYSHNPNVFFSSKQRRYGDIFKTRILGCPCIMIANPEAARFILVTQAHLFKPTFPPSKQGLVGHQALFFHDGAYHARLRRLVQSLFLPETIRGTVSDIEEICQTMLNSWEGRTINTYMEMRKYAFDVSLLMILRCQKGLDKEGLNDAFCTMEKGYNSMPIDFPGTKFSSATKARKHLSEIIRRIISERRRKGVVYPDLLGSLLKFEDENRMGLTNDQIVDNIVGVIFASRHTTASILIWLVKFLKDSPSVLEAVIAEHESIRQSKLASNPSLTWEDTKNMRLTSRVIQETLRVATILSFTFREAVEDVEYKGYVIPKGWKVMPLFRSIHHSPEFFPDPHKFDPSRFEVPPKPNTFLPFGNGVHSCPGNELAKLEMLIFVHHLTTKFRWEFNDSKPGMHYSPFLVPKGGLQMTVVRK